MKFWQKIFLVCSILVSNFALADVAPKIIFPQDHFYHQNANEEWWAFSGIIKTEAGTVYTYSYKVFKEDQKITVIVHVFNKRNHLKVFDYTASKILKDDSKEKINFKIGKAFLNYNIISKNWTFGVLEEHNGFNFRVNSLRPYVLNGDDGYLNYQKNDFFAYYSAQSMSINGNLTLDNKSEFITGKDSWFDHQWKNSTAQKNLISYQLITCRFSDNTGMMLYRYKENDNGKHRVIKAATIQDDSGKVHRTKMFALAYDQDFTSIKDKISPLQWKIAVPTEKIDIKLIADYNTQIYKTDLMQEVYEGSAKLEGNKKGYCFINQWATTALNVVENYTPIAP